ncbi:MAG: YchJ family metal-binding protein [Myxococcota bacterium]|nr:YchJ family metal-binding protein [Myxococcota bacterium]
MAKLNPNAPCLCGSGKKYKRCCRRIHHGAPPATPESLMRARYVGYALGLVEFIMRTTDPEGPRWVSDSAGWQSSIVQFSTETEFTGLTVHRVGADDASTGTVAFTAHLEQAGTDASFSEVSVFVRRHGQWLYHAGETSVDHAAVLPDSTED